jgi:hypothetical protein
VIWHCGAHEHLTVKEQKADTLPSFNSEVPANSAKRSVRIAKKGYSSANGIAVKTIILSLVPRIICVRLMRVHDCRHIMLVSLSGPEGHEKHQFHFCKEDDIRRIGSPK